MFQLIIFATIFSNGFSFAIPKLDGRIYGGYETTIEEFPYIVELIHGGRHHCGGTVISPYVVITAAHCTDGLEAENLHIKYGVTNRLDAGSKVQVKTIHKHPGFEWKHFQNDISVLLMVEPIQFSDRTQPIELPEYKEDPSVDIIAFASGWGYTESNEESDILRTVDIKVIAKDLCLKKFGSNRYTEKNICAGSDDHKKDACGGDSGGPLVANNKLIGIVSWGYGCGSPTYPGMYTNVAEYREWIDVIIRNNVL